MKNCHGTRRRTFDYQCVRQSLEVAVTTSTREEQTADAFGIIFIQQGSPGRLVTDDSSYFVNTNFNFATNRVLNVA